MSHSNHDSQSTPLVQGTDDIKLSACQCSGMIITGAVLVIENTLSFTEDQYSKISNASIFCGPVNAVQLEIINERPIMKKLANAVKCMKRNSQRGTLFLLISPKSIFKKWEPLCTFMLRSKLLSLVVVDEVHQFVTCGTSFRPKFMTLHDFTFSKIILFHVSDNKEQHLKAPVILMTETMNQ